MIPISLFDLSKLIRQTLERQLEETYWVMAEIGELRLHQRGHCYLELVEKQADVLVTKQRATIWSSAYRGISQNFESVTGQYLAPGLKILCQVQVQYHELYGLSLNIREIDPNYTLGERARKRAEIIQRLISEGMYELNRQHVLNQVPQRIAVISSPTAAGWGDFLHQLLHNSWRYRFEPVLFKATMQGDAAHESICQALASIAASAQPFDAVVIIRGGGARIDLDCFDHYELARSIAKFHLPVLTGIGHDRDETIADLVAHTRLKTPTAVAEFLIATMRAYEEQLERLANTIFAYAEDYLIDQQHGLNQIEHSLQVSARNLLAAQSIQLANLGSSLGSNSKHRIKWSHERLKNLQRILISASDKALCRESASLDQLALSLQLQDPARLMKKGYTITYLDGKPLHKAQQPKKGQLLITHASNQIITSKIENTITENYAS